MKTTHFSSNYDFASRPLGETSASTHERVHHSYQTNLNLDSGDNDGTIIGTSGLKQYHHHQHSGSGRNNSLNDFDSSLSVEGHHHQYHHHHHHHHHLSGSVATIDTTSPIGSVLETVGHDSTIAAVGGAVPLSSPIVRQSSVYENNSVPIKYEPISGHHTEKNSSSSNNINSNNSTSDYSVIQESSSSSKYQQKATSKRKRETSEYKSTYFLFEFPQQLIQLVSSFDEYEFHL
jgi:hypothetical protein